MSLSSLQTLRPRDRTEGGAEIKGIYLYIHPYMPSVGKLSNGMCPPVFVCRPHTAVRRPLICRRSPEIGIGGFSQPKGGPSLPAGSAPAGGRPCAWLGP